MADQDRGSDDPQLSAIARHALHDEELVAAFAAGGVEDAADNARARSLVERCATCREIHGDLTAIRAAIRASGSAAERSASMTAPRDFRLTAEDAARLRPGAPVARLAARAGWRARLGLGIVAFGRPVGAAMATFGVVGLLVGSLALGGGPLATMRGSAGAPSAAAGIENTAQAPDSSRNLASSRPNATAEDGSLGSGEQVGRGGSGTLVLLGGSLTLLIVGIGLILAARRGVGGTSMQRGN